MTFETSQLATSGHVPRKNLSEQLQHKRVLKNPVFLKLGFLDFALWGFFDFFYLNEQLGSLLVDLAHQLSFYFDWLVVEII